MRILICFVVIGFVGWFVPAVRACGCGYVDASSRCPGCTSTPGSVGCSCNTSTGNCQDMFGNPPTAYVLCKWDTWMWTQDDEGDVICAELKACYVTKVCQVRFPGLPCNDFNGCSIPPAVEVQNWRYYVYDDDCIDH